MIFDLREGDCIKEMVKLLKNGIKVDSIVTDPPYHLTSIVKRFNKTSKEDDNKTGHDAKEGKTQYGRLSKGFMGQKWDGGDIAFQVNTWKLAYHLLKPGGHLIAFGGTRTIHRMVCAIEDAGFEIRDQIMWLYGTGFPKSHKVGEGQGTGLKPAVEPICLARKPIKEKTVAKNVEKYGVGGLFIDDCRVQVNAADNIFAKNPHTEGGFGHATAKVYGKSKGAPKYDPKVGRWPANVIHDGSEEVMEEFTIYGNKPGCKSPSRAKSEGTIFSGARSQGAIYGDNGSAARFFYSAKTSKKERGEFNDHPTVKPVALMSYLIHLVTPKGGIVLDPFMGSGSTGIAAKREGYGFIGIEAEPTYFEIAKNRIDDC